MSFDAWVGGFGLSRVLIELKLLGGPWAYSVMAITILIDSYLLYVFFTSQKVVSHRSRTLSSFRSAYVCFWHKADIPVALRNVRFWG